MKTLKRIALATAFISAAHSAPTMAYPSVPAGPGKITCTLEGNVAVSAEFRYKQAWRSEYSPVYKKWWWNIDPNRTVCMKQIPKKIVAPPIQKAVCIGGVWHLGKIAFPPPHANNC